MVQPWPSKSWPSDLEGCGTAMQTRHISVADCWSDADGSLKTRDWKTRGLKSMDSITKTNDDERTDTQMIVRLF